MSQDFSFKIKKELKGTRARTGVVSTPHGDIQTPAFIVVGTKATVKALTPEMVQEIHGQAVLANAYHLYLQPGPKIIEQAGGLGKFMNWPGPTFTDSGGFQVLSLGSGFKKVLAMGVEGAEESELVPAAARKAIVDDDGVTFESTSGRQEAPLHAGIINPNPARHRRRHYFRFRRADLTDLIPMITRSNRWPAPMPGRSAALTKCRGSGASIPTGPTKRCSASSRAPITKT